MATATGSNGRHGLVTSAAEVRRIVGPLGDDTVAEILRVCASPDELEIAVHYARGEGDRADRIGHPLSGRAAQVYEILRDEEADPEEDASPR
jgi:hypothetical protein